ncbi:MAG: O-succinylhomoserine sulfhydrylase [Polaribacter sp.]|jgi:O-succinylhomoserine sulfhydrylase
MKKSKFETLAIRTQVPESAQKEHSVPLYLTSSFTFDSAEDGAAIFSGEQEGNLYSRFSNPNTDEFIAKLKLMEDCEAGVATASGMAAVYTAMAAHLCVGDHVLAASAIFGNSRYILSNILSKMGVTATFVEVDNNKAWEEAVQKNTKLLYVESPSNPTLKTADLEFLGQLCKANNICYVMDNCFATPYLQQPAKYGADLVLHSATKYIDGQGRVLGGAILGKEEPVKACYDFLRRTGASLSPFNAWVLSKSLETLGLRMDRHCSNALAVAKFLEGHKEVSNVIYPHLESYNQYDLAKKQMSQGGGLVGCEIKGSLEKGRRFLNNLTMHSLTANLGDSRSIATHPASTTHARLTEQEQLEIGITPGFVRFSVGLEHVDDIIIDIEEALNRL